MPSSIARKQIVMEALHEITIVKRPNSICLVKAANGLIDEEMQREIDRISLDRLADHVRLTEDRSVTMLALAMISAAWFFIGAAAGALAAWMVLT